MPMRLVGEINRLVKNAEKLQPKENVFFEKEGMQASLVVPEKNTQRWTKEGKLPLVVVVHGLSAHSRQSLIRQIAGLHEELGLPVMRLNFQDKPERMFPIHEKAAFLSEALEKALTNSRIDASRVELIGQSQGGLEPISVDVLKRLPFS